MSDEQTATDEQTAAEEFAAGQDPDSQAGLAARVAELEGQVETLTRERDDALGKVEKAEKAATAAKAKVTRGASPAKPRKLGPMEDGLTGVDLDDAIMAATAEEKKVEIAFSDGNREIIGIPPVNVEGEAWKAHARGKMLRDPIKVQGPAPGMPGFAIDGYALLIDGKPVAYCKRSDVINVAPGREINIADDIFF